jgi:hypothetical protein
MKLCVTNRDSNRGGVNRAKSFKGVTGTFLSTGTRLSDSYSSRGRQGSEISSFSDTLLDQNCS